MPAVKKRKDTVVKQSTTGSLAGSQE